MTLTGAMLTVARGAPGISRDRSLQAAAVDTQNLRLAADAIESAALASGALGHTLSQHDPASVILLSDEALLGAAVRADPSRTPRDTTAVMGPAPYNMTHPVRHGPGHARINATHTLDGFRHAVYVAGSPGWGMFRHHNHSTPAQFQKPDGVYVDPRLPALHHPTIALVAIRAALAKLGQPYVWAAAGPNTFDCSGLTRWAYAKAGVLLTHYTGDQWNEGRLIPGRDALPGDLLLFGRHIHHVGMYLGAGWMLNAPFTGHYVDVVPVETQLTGVVRP